MGSLFGRPGPPGPPGVGTPGPTGPAGADGAQGPAGPGLDVAAFDALIAKSAPSAGWKCADASGDLQPAYGSQTLVKHGNPTYRAAGPHGTGSYAVSGLDGSNWFESAAAITALNTPGEWTIEAGVYLPTKASVFTPCIVGYGVGGKGEGLAFGGASTGSSGDPDGTIPLIHRYSVVWVPFNGTLEYEAILSAGWHHFAFQAVTNISSSTPTTCRLFIDGQVHGQSTTAPGTPDSTARFVVGNMPGGAAGVSHSTLRVCHVYAYNRQVPDLEVKAHAAMFGLLRA